MNHLERKKKAYYNTAASLLLEAVTIVCGLILPRLILQRFGSAYNGIVSSITQFISCVTLLRSGLGGVIRAALYKPLADNDNERISCIVKQSEVFMTRVARIYSACLVLFALIYPIIVIKDFRPLFSSTLVIILGLSTYFECRFAIAYQFLLQADQKRYIVALIRSVCLILNCTIAALLIKTGCSIHIVKLGSAFAFSLSPLFIYIYVRRNYTLNRNCREDGSVLTQRWDAFAHQVAAFIMSNTDVMVLTLFTDMPTVSIYSVYNMITAPMKNFVLSFANGVEAAFGNMLAKNENELLKRSFELYTYCIFTISSLLFTCTGILITPFIMVYTVGVHDADYFQPLFGCLMTLAQFIACTRIPFQTMVETAGKFKETRNGAILEALINIVVSILLVNFIGLIGVVIGTIVALLFRTVQYALYVDKHQITGCFRSFVKHIVQNSAFAAFSCLTVYLVQRKFKSFLEPDGSYAIWFVHAVIVFLLCTILMIIIQLLTNKKQFLGMLNSILSSIKKRRKQTS